MRLIGLVVQSEALPMKEGGVARGGVGMAVVVDSCDMRIGGNISIGAAIALAIMRRIVVFLRKLRLKRRYVGKPGEGILNSEMI
jgi:hypothetical protein